MRFLSAHFLQSAQIPLNGVMNPLVSSVSFLSSSLKHGIPGKSNFPSSTLSQLLLSVTAPFLISEKLTKPLSLLDNHMLWRIQPAVGCNQSNGIGLDLNLAVLFMQHCGYVSLNNSHNNSLPKLFCRYDHAQLLRQRCSMFRKSP